MSGWEWSTSCNTHYCKMVNDHYSVLFKGKKKKLRSAFISERECYEHNVHDHRTFYFRCCYLQERLVTSETPGATLTEVSTSFHCLPTHPEALHSGRKLFREKALSWLLLEAEMNLVHLYLEDFCG